MLSQREACYSSMPSSASLAAWPNSLTSGVHNSLVAGKNAGDFADLAANFETPSRKHLLIQQFASEFPT
jgi:hypothetical protein